MKNTLILNIMNKKYSPPTLTCIDVRLNHVIAASEMSVKDYEIVRDDELW